MVEGGEPQGLLAAQSLPVCVLCNGSCPMNWKKNKVFIFYSQCFSLFSDSPSLQLVPALGDGPGWEAISDRKGVWVTAPQVPAQPLEAPALLGVPAGDSSAVP